MSKLLGYVGAIAASTALFASASITKECMLTTNMFGDAKRVDDIEFVSNMQELVTIGEQIMFMRTVDLYVCSSTSSIHGIRVHMMHDPAKEPADSGE